MKTFKGGHYIPGNKHLTKNAAIELMPIVPDYYVALSQHIGEPAILCVEIGETVCEGQLIAKANGIISANVHSPVCGTVVEVVKRRNSQGVMADFVHIKSNGEQNVVTYEPLTNPTREQIVQRIADAGIVGMGGAGFPTAAKIQTKNPLDTLIINVAECEPYLNCDNRLVIERTKEFIEGVRLLATACGVQHVYIGIEDNKPADYAAMLAIDGVVDEKGPITPGDIVVVKLKEKYPQGAEKMLVYACTKRKVPTGCLPSAVGCIVNNAATAYAVWDAVVNGRPLYKRLMTLSGRGIRCPKNVEVRIGTPLPFILEMCDNLTDDTVKLVVGGPMMGFTLVDTNVTITKVDRGFLALTAKEASTTLPTPCIRCGRCVDVCPMHLTPLMIDFSATVNDFEGAIKYGALNCFECGTCAYVCPAKRPIVQSVRLTKIKAKEIK